MLAKQKLKGEIQTNRELTDLLDTLKWIAISQFRLLRARKERFTRFLEALESFFEGFGLERADHPFLAGKGKRGIILITSDEGFMGGLNTQVVHKALEVKGAQDAVLVTVGEKGKNLLRDMNLPYVDFPGISLENRKLLIRKLQTWVCQETLEGRLGETLIVHPSPVSFTVQKIEAVNVLPYRFDKTQPSPALAGQKVLLESSPYEMINYLTETRLIQLFDSIFEESKLSEFSARAVHLEEIYQDLTKQGKHLRGQYFRAQHEIIDKGIREVFSSQILSKRKRETELAAPSA